MRKTRNHNRITESYVRSVRQSLDCPKDLRKALISEIEQQITELENKTPELTVDDLYREIGTPEEIAQGFEDRDDIDRIRKKAAKYKRSRIIAWVCAILAVVSIVTSTIAIVIICENDGFHEKIIIKDGFKENSESP